MNRVFRGAVLAVSVIFPSSAFAAEIQCISRAELRTGIAYIMPAVISGIVTKCTPLLNAESYFATSGQALISRYENESKGTENEVRALFAKFGPQAGLSGVDATSTAALVESAVSVGIQSAVKPKDCDSISQAMSFLDPLPAANMNGLLEFVATKVDEGSRRKSQATKDSKKDVNKGGKKPRRPFLCEIDAVLGGTAP